MIGGLIRLKEAIGAGCNAAARRWQWPASLQLEHARSIVEQDLRWLCLDKKLEAVCERHLALLGPDWMSRGIQEISTFRNSIGADPHTPPVPPPAEPKPKPVLPADRLPIFVRNDDDYCQAMELCKAIEQQNNQALSANAFYIYAVPALNYALRRIGSLQKAIDENNALPPV